ncbi:MAG: NAD(P)/FAD-dependent oxidoreductase [Actinobacteria bacterium]|nr:NAD(P)/FAD-dependent oxidoreductase [Actinomycetota bacterium]
MNKYDAIVIGSGHNGLVAACYLAKAGKSVLVLEKNASLGGATTSVKAFKGIDAKLSRYSYLVSLLPDQIIKDLSLNFETIARAVSSYTPYFDGESEKGLLINSDFDQESRDSLSELTGSQEEAIAWQNFYQSIKEFAQVIAPTMLKPVPSESEVRELVDPLTWVELVENTLAQSLNDNFLDDLVKGVALTDGLIGTFTSADDHLANKCFIYHVIGNSTGQWRVPKGGMGVLVDQLLIRAEQLGVEIVASQEVCALTQNSDHLLIKTQDGRSYQGKVALANCAPSVLEKIGDFKAPPLRDGSQVKINMVLKELPKLKSGADPRKAFAGTFHVNESYFELEQAFVQAKTGQIPEVIPSELYCHSLADASILHPDLVAAGFHSLTIFALHLPASLFDKDHDLVKAEVEKRILAGFSQYLERPIESYLAKDSDGHLCIEVKTPQELEKELGLPRGNIFHSDLQFPWKEDGDSRKWGVETNSERIFLAGAGALRGGGVSGIAGHNAAMAALETLAKLT